MNATEPLLKNLRIAYPCTARWEDMEGDERSRFCRQCTKYVYNFSTFTTHEAAELIRAREGQLCARFYQRADGTILTADCPVGAERPLHWFKQFISAAAACLCLSSASARPDEKPRSATSSQRALLGEMCVARSGTNDIKQTVPSTNFPPFLGKIAIAPPRLNSATPAPAITTNPSPNTPKNH